MDSKNIIDKIAAKKGTITKILIFLTIIGIILTSIDLYQNSFGLATKPTDISYKYTITEDTVTVKIIPRVDIKELNYTINFSVPFSKILNNPEGYDITEYKALAKRNEPIIHKYKTENVKKLLKGYNVDSVSVYARNGKVQNKYTIRPYEKGYQATETEVFKIIGISLIATSLVLFIVLIVIITIKKSKESNNKNECETNTIKETLTNNIEQPIIEQTQKSTDTICFICGKPSNNKIICRSCLELSEKIMNELPSYEISSYNDLIIFKQETIDDILYADSKEERNLYILKLFAIAHILYRKYSIEDIYSGIYSLIEKLSEEENTSNNEITDKETENKEQETNNKTKYKYKASNTDFRQRYPKPFRCDDGDYVRSKAEREIDNFFFENRIWHIYEPEYICKDKKKYYPDFFLPDYNLYIEYFGGSEEKYLKKKKEKIKKFSEEQNINFEYLEYSDDSNLSEKLTQLCKKYNIPSKYL